MRPGQAAPEFRYGKEKEQCSWERASMRPGQAAPEFRVDVVVFRHLDAASMRPGQAAPEFPVPASRFDVQSMVLQ